MKYDSSMTQFHGDIAAAIKSMIYSQEEAVMKLASDGSPAPLREYLRDQHGRSRHGGNKFDCTPQNFSVKFDAIINNLGDKVLTLSWSQVATFIRNNAAEIFSEDESADDDILPDKNSLELLCNTFDESKIECPFWHTGQTMQYVNIGGVDFKCDYCECSFCEFDKLTEFLASHCHDYEECLYYRKHKDDKSDFPCDGCGYDDNNCCSYPDTPNDYCVCGDKKIPAPTLNDTAAVFDYSELDNSIAKSLRDCEAVIRQETAGYFTILGAKFKEAQDLLANHSSGTFERWYTSMGFKRQTVYNLIQRFEFSSSPKIEGREDAFEALPLTLSYEISKPTAPAELVDKVLEGDITSNAEYKKLLAELERTKDELRQVDANSAAKDKEYQRELEEAEKQNAILNAAKEQFHNASKANLEKLNEERKRNAELEQRVKELESRPIDVAVQTDEAALAEKDEEIAELKEQLERLSDKSIKTFAIRMTIDEYERLANIVEKIDDINVKSAVKTARMIRI